MANPPENLVLELLRDIRATLKSHDDRFDDIETRFDHFKMEFAEFKKNMGEIREAVYMSAGMAAHANLKHDSVAERLDDPERVPEKLLDFSDNNSLLNKKIEHFGVSTKPEMI